MRSRVDGTFEFEDGTIFAFSCSADARFEEEFHWINWAVRGPDEDRVTGLALGVRRKLLRSIEEFTVVDDEYAQGWAAIFSKVLWSQEREDRLLTFTRVAEEKGWWIP